VIDCGFQHPLWRAEMNVDTLITSLLTSDIASIRYKIRVNVLSEDPHSDSIKRLRDEIKRSPVVQALLSQQDDGGQLVTRSVYDKWQGAHWVLATLADIGYPEGDLNLAPIRDQLQAQWLSENYYQEFDAPSRAAAYRKTGVPVMNGRHRRCASQQANALWSILKLGLANEQTEAFVERLLHWQWPDGGWNCDKNPAACNSSFMESILPLRVLSLYAEQSGNEQVSTAVARAAEIFLKRRLFLRQRDSSIIKAEFVALHYPLYWHYDILHGLKILAEAGYINDPNCSEALELLASKHIAGGGWPADKKYYRTSSESGNGCDYVDWGGTSNRTMNPWITADALFVLKSAGMIAAATA